MRYSILRYKHHSFAVLLPVFFLPLIVGIINYVFDPLQIYRQQKCGQVRFWVNQRYQNAGKIRSYLSEGGYDSILVGNSVADNFRPSMIADYLGWKKTMKLTVDGGHASEQAFTVEQALHCKNVKRVLWVIRALNFSIPAKERWHETEHTPFYLYTRSIIDDGPYIFSLDTLKYSWTQLLGKDYPNNWQKDLESLNYWMSREKIESLLQYNSNSNLKKLRGKKNHKGCRFEVDPKERFPAADYNILRLIREHPQVEFIIAVAPMTRQSLASRSHNSLSRYFGVQKYLVIQTADLSNTRVYGFENDDIIVANLANFRDPIHYHSGVNKLMLYKMSHDQNRLTLKNIDKYISAISKKLCVYTVQCDFSIMLPLALQDERTWLYRLRHDVDPDTGIVSKASF